MPTNNNKNNRKKPMLLCILDGWGIGDQNSPYNAIALAKTPNYDQILSNYPNSQLGTSGLDVGLPDGQIGNSEVGHISIGSGRIIFQDLPRVNNAISDGSLAKNPQLQNLILELKKTGGACHLLGLLSDGGVHSHQDHIIALAKIIAANGIVAKIHAFLDGRDVAQKSAIGFIQNLQNQIKNFPNIEIATIGGRYFAMDRDKNWDRIQLAYNSIASAIGEKSSDATGAIEENYAKNITDEFIKPIVIGDYSGINDGDGFLFANFRADRAREISHALIDPNFKEFTTKKISFAAKISTTEYSEKLNPFFDVLFPKIEIKNSLGEIFSDLNLQQLRIAETEKYAHVTFFFSGGREKTFTGEERILVQSPAVATYDLMPQMACETVGEKLKAAIDSNKYDFIVVNYANPDMVGHSGILSSSIKACEAIDFQLGMLRDAILKQDGLMLISADHGNIENMIDENNHPHTSHTTNPVPLILIGNDVKNIQLKNGKLCDIAPTILHLMNIPQPPQMTGQNLIKND